MRANERSLLNGLLRAGANKVAFDVEPDVIRARYDSTLKEPVKIGKLGGNTDKFVP